MASTAEMSAGTLYPDLAALRRPLFPAIRWGAVLAGVAVGISVQLALTLLGVATGLSNATVMTPGRTAGIVAIAWTGLSMLIAAFAGGYVAARMSGLKRKSDGVLHGVVCWAVTTLLFASLASSAAGGMVSGLFNGMQAAGVAAGPAVSSMAQPGGGGELGAMLRREIRGNVSPDALQSLMQSIRAGQRDQAINQLVNNIGVDDARAASIVDQALILSGSPRSASPQARTRANQAVSAAGTAAWAVFLGVALSLLLGIAGGALGAMGSRRTTWVARADDAVPATPTVTVRPRPE